MAARLRATKSRWAFSPTSWGLGSAGLGLCLMAAAGCASTDTGSNSIVRKATPSFMLSDQEKAERSLKDPAALNLAYGRFQEQSNQPQEAHKSYEKALADNPHSVEAVLGLARLDQLADKPKEAEVGFQHALRMKPNDPAVLAACGQFYSSQKRWPEAYQALNAAIAAAPKVPIYKHQLAIAQTRAGNIDAALGTFGQLVGPEKAHYNVGFLLAQEGKQDAAAQQCRAALAVNPTFEPARQMLEQMHNRQVAGDPRGLTKPAGGRTVAQTGAAAPAGNGFAPIPGSVAAGGRPTQAAWQTSGTSSNTATRADASFDAALPKVGAANRPEQVGDFPPNPWGTTPPAAK